ncbi:MAG: isopentenyl phosphate kinase [Thermoplasmata archaeon]
MPNSGPVLVKLGGSVITRKQGESALRPKILARLAEEIASVKDVPVVLLHGAGSYGHPGAARWKLSTAPETDGETPPASDHLPSVPLSRARGASIVQYEVRRLHGSVLQTLLDHGVTPWSTPAATIARNRAGELVAFDELVIRDALDRNVVPVTFGDVVPDELWGFSILSADTIAVDLVTKLQPRRVVFVSDVPGILDPAGGQRPSVIPEASPALLERLKAPAGTADVTGGIRAKLRAMLAISALGVDAGLISGLSDGTLSRALRGEKVYGTWAEGISP